MASSRTTSLFLALAVLGLARTAWAQMKEGDGSGQRPQPHAREESVTERKELDADQRGQQQNKMPDAPPTGPGPSAEAMKRLAAGMGQMGGGRDGGAPLAAAEDEDKTQFTDPRTFVVRGEGHERGVNVNGEVNLPDGTILKVSVYRDKAAILTTDGVVVSGGHFNTRLEAPGILAAGPYKVEAEYRRSDQPFDVRDLLPAGGKERLVAFGPASRGDEIDALAEQITILFRVHVALREMQAVSKGVRSLESDFQAGTRFGRGERFDDGAWREAVQVLRDRAFAAYAPIQLLGDSYYVKPLPEMWDRAKTRLTILFDATAALTAEAYEASGGQYAEPAWPFEVSAFYIARPPTQPFLSVAEMEDATHAEFAAKYAIATISDLQSLTWGWAATSITHDLESIDKIFDGAEDSKEFDPAAWGRDAALWRFAAQSRPKSFEGLLSALRAVCPLGETIDESPPTQAKQALQQVDRLWGAYTRKIHSDRGVPVPAECVDAPEVGDVRAEIAQARDAIQ